MNRRPASGGLMKSLAQAERKARSLEALNLSRRRGISRAAAARSLGISTDDIIRYTGDAWQNVGGRWKPKPDDDLSREMVVLRPDGPTYESIEGLGQASLNGSYHNAVRRYLEHGDVVTLSKFEGRALTIDGERVPFLTDLVTLDRLARGAELHYELYKR